jgi:DNA-binding CsgD family transcriptional regulator
MLNPMPSTENSLSGRLESSRYAEDLALARRIAAGDEPSWRAFLEAYNKHIEAAAIGWCHRSMAGRVCGRCKPGACDAEAGCDAFSDAYLYILERFRRTALASYGGRTALSSFVYLCLHDYRWWASFVQKETGKIKLPKALENEPAPVQQIYYRIRWGWDAERIAGDLRLSPEEVAAVRERIEQTLRNAGRSLTPGRMKTISLSAALEDGEEEEPRVAEPRSSEISLEMRSEATRYWSKLSVRDRTLLRLVVESDRSTAEIARILGLTAQQVYGAVYRIRRQMPEWFKMQSGQTKPSPRSVQIMTGGARK